MAEEIEVLTVKLEADTTKLLADTRRGVGTAERELDKLSKSGKGVFDSANKGGLNFANILSGAVGGAVVGLTTKLVDMAAAGVQAFAGMISKAVELASTYQGTRVLFENILGSPEEADAVLEHIRDTALSIGQDVAGSTSLAQSFLPDVESLQQLDEIVKAAAGLQILQPERTAEDARIALEQALSGDTLSLTDRFNIPDAKRVREQIKEAQEELGPVNGLLKVMGEVLEKNGVKVEDFGKTASGQFGLLNSIFNDFLLNIGKPVLEPLTAGLESINAVLLQNEDKIGKLAETIGQGLAKAAESGIGLLVSAVESIPWEQVQAGAEFFNRLVGSIMAFTGEAARFGSAFQPILDFFNALSPSQVILEKIGQGLSRIDEALETGAQLLAISAAGWKGLFVAIQPVGEVLGLMVEGLLALKDLDLETATAKFTAATERIKKGLIDMEAGRAAAQESLRQSAESISAATAQPEAEAPTEGGGEITFPTKPIEESGEEAKELFDKYATELLDLQEETAQKQEELATEHGQAMADIEAEAVQERLEAAKELEKDLAELERDTADKRAEIAEDTADKLADLEQDTNEKLADERKDFQEKERRETEDHQEDMRRLQQDYLDNLADAVKDRDARAIVDLRRKFQRDKAEKEQDFATDQSRSTEDFEQSQAETRENAERQRQEILTNQQEQLADLQENERRKREELMLSYQEQLAQIDQNALEAKTKEQMNFEERKAQLDAAMATRLEAIAKELADEAEINEEGSAKILETLATYFGEDGEIDALMKAYQARMATKMEIEIAFSGKAASTDEEGETASDGPKKPPGKGKTQKGGLQSFQSGGVVPGPIGQPRQIIAHGGERFLGVGAAAERNTPPQRFEIVFSGSAPPGIGAADREQIAAVVVSALRQAGAERGN